MPGQRAAAGAHGLVVLGRSNRETLDVTLVDPEPVVEVGVDAARDASGRRQHAALWHRARPCPSRPDTPAGRRRTDGGTGVGPGYGAACPGRLVGMTAGSWGMALRELRPL
ncbi:hypothetical protein GCM10010236_07760 [Streptomyces eurythermus]|nr:hypothetical protein GCM10010236_07760 [Streptomyces eurythermus]